MILYQSNIKFAVVFAFCAFFALAVARPQLFQGTVKLAVCLVRL